LKCNLEEWTQIKDALDQGQVQRKHVRVNVFY